MTRAALLAVLALLAALAAAADDAPGNKKKDFSGTSIGEGGGYKPSDPATDSYMEGGLRESVARRSEPESPGLPSSAPERAPSRNEAPPPAREKPAASLWNGPVRPLDVPGAKPDAGEADAASESAARDYDSRVLGLKAAPPRPRLDDAAGAASLAAAAPQAGGTFPEGKVFVSIEIDPRESGSLRDAVAGLSAASGFAADARFDALAGPGGTALLGGWISSAKLGEALARPGVKSLRMESRARPGSTRRTTGDFLVGLRVEDDASARGVVEAGVKDLAASSGFALTRVVGLEKAPDGRSVALIEGRLPISRLSAAMARSSVAKISPLIASVPAAAPAAAAPARRGFARFALERGPELILVTLFLALPSLRAPAKRAAAVLSPYR